MVMFVGHVARGRGGIGRNEVHVRDGGTGRGRGVERGAWRGSAEGGREGRRESGRRRLLHLGTCKPVECRWFRQQGEECAKQEEVREPLILLLNIGCGFCELLESARRSDVDPEMQWETFRPGLVL